LAAHSLDTDLQLLSAQSRLLVETRQVPGASLKSLSRAQSLVQLLRRSPNTLSRRRLDYPADVLEQQGIVNDQLYQSTTEGQTARIQAARSIAQIALADLQGAAADLKSVKSLRPLYLSKAGSSPRISARFLADCSVCLVFRLRMNVGWLDCQSKSMMCCLLISCGGTGSCLSGFGGHRSCTFRCIEL